MAARKRPAAAPPRIGDVRKHVVLVREIMADFPEWGYKHVGARLGELLGARLGEPKWHPKLEAFARLCIENLIYVQASL